ncbi:putative transcription factor C2H2 family [Medicago truncatula]|uniref:E3 ubiquitin-protein ligase RNF170 n=1 Tax=Medicago truncatula TaxID=3880 RepID=G7J069_MEDTR|nr:E3 ubiquitin-protein ligase RNF170 [Medicago truncatula]AES68312.1 C3HC4-type RING finger protein [Medicago truncatula]RHN65233.1 putative transcription factor C2H2 family [Medicago truncatula]
MNEEIESGEGPPTNDLCSICHGNFQLPCQANCSHWFCANCIIQVWQYSSPLQPCKCPLCRRPINLLVPTDVVDDANSEQDRLNLADIQRYNRVFGQQSNASIVQRLRDLPFLLKRLFKDFVNPNTSLPLVIRARVFITMLLSIIYIFSPIDIIPEGMLGIIGLLDDVLIALIFFLHVAALYRSVLYLRHGGS